MKRSPMPRRRRPLRRTGGPRRKSRPKSEGARELDRAARAEFRRVLEEPCAQCGDSRDQAAREGRAAWFDPHPHHVLDKQAIKAYVRSIKGGADLLRRLLWDVRNAMCLCDRCHARHTLAVDRVSRETLREHHWQFARELGEWAVVRLEDQYPA